MYIVGVGVFMLMCSIYMYMYLHMHEELHVHIHVYFSTCKDVDTSVTAITGVPTIIIAKRMNVQNREQRVTLMYCGRVLLGNAMRRATSRGQNTGGMKVNR